MAFDFPDAPLEGAVYAPVGGPTYTFTNGAWTSSGTGGGGGTPVDAYTKAESDAAFVNVPGDTMTGPLVLPADPVALLEAATKQYVDTHLTQAEADPLYLSKTADNLLTATGFTKQITAGQTALTAGMSHTPPVTGSGNMQIITIDGAVTLNAPGGAGDAFTMIVYAWWAAAGSLTLAGFGKISGDALTTSAGSSCMLYITCINGLKTVFVEKIAGTLLRDDVQNAVNEIKSAPKIGTQPVKPEIAPTPKKGKR